MLRVVARALDVVAGFPDLQHHALTARTSRDLLGELLVVAPDLALLVSHASLGLGIRVLLVHRAVRAHQHVPDADVNADARPARTIRPSLFVDLHRQAGEPAPGLALDGDLLEAASQTQGLAHADLADARQLDVLGLTIDALVSVADAEGSVPVLAVKPGGGVFEARVVRGPDRMAQGVESIVGSFLSQLLAPRKLRSFDGIPLAPQCVHGRFLSRLLPIHVEPQAPVVGGAGIVCGPGEQGFLLRRRIEGHLVSAIQVQVTGFLTR